MKVHWFGALLCAGAFSLVHAGAAAVPPAPSGGSVVPAPLPDQLPGDPTKVTPRFEKTFRELAGDNRPAGSAGAAAPQMPDIRLLGRIRQGEGNAGIVMLQVGDQVVRARAGSDETTVFLNGQPIRLRVDQLGEQGVRLFIQPFNQSLILR